jgi:hypothetical protein
MPRIVVVLPSDRSHTGVLSFLDDQGHRIAGPFRVFGQADRDIATKKQNPNRDTLKPFGNTPTGTYRVDGFVPPKDFADSLKHGAIDRIVITPTGGDALVAKGNGRTGLEIHGGHLGAGGVLRPTSGCLRLSDSDMASLVGTIQVFGVPGFTETVEVDVAEPGAPTGADTGGDDDDDPPSVDGSPSPTPTSIPAAPKLGTVIGHGGGGLKGAKELKDVKDIKEGKETKEGVKEGKDNKEGKEGKELSKDIGKEAKEGKEGKEHGKELGKEAFKEGKESKEGKHGKEEKDNKEDKDGKEHKEGKDGKENKDHKEDKDGKEGKEGKESKEGKDGKDGKESKEGKDGKEDKDGKEGDSEDKEMKEHLDIPSSILLPLPKFSKHSPAVDPGPIDIDQPFKLTFMKLTESL